MWRLVWGQPPKPALSEVEGAVRLPAGQQFYSAPGTRCSTSEYPAVVAPFHGSSPLSPCGWSASASTRESSLVLLFCCLAAPARFFAGLDWVASGDFFVPGGMESPGPGFGDRAANHGAKRSGLADR